MILDDIVTYKKIQIQKEKEDRPLKDYLPLINKLVLRDFKAAINKKVISIIAEIKKASPSSWIIKDNFDPVKIANVYNELDIDAVSVLTERKFFMGEDSYIAEVKKVNSKPVLRKDFIIDEYQVYQAKALGADAILLIAAILGRELERFYVLTQELGLKALTEVHNERELDIALNAGCDIIGINNRDLRDFSVSLKTTEQLMRCIPKGIVTVSESGIKTPDDIHYLRKLGVNSVLIGETFMRSIDHRNKITNFISESKGLKL